MSQDGNGAEHLDLDSGLEPESSCEPVGAGESKGAEHTHADSGGGDDRGFFYSAGLWVRDGGVGVAIVVAGLLLLTATAGVWPPMTVVESGSMEPNINQGDMTIVSASDRFVNEFADENGVVTHSVADEEGVENLGGYGSVIVFKDPSTSGPDTIHRAMFHVEEGEDWFDRANESFLYGATSCSQLRNCPAPNDGYITKGDNNPYYDQAIGLSRPVAGEWVGSVARVDIPYLGWIRLIFSGRLIM